MTSLVIEFKVKPLYVCEGTTELGKWVLRRFQEEILRNVSERKDSILVAPTGSGKTLSLLLGEYGFVGIYPNNTLMLDQQRSIHKILTEALGAKVTYRYSMRRRGRQENAEILRVYELPPGVRGEPPILSYGRVAVILLSGRYIGYEYDEEGRLVPKRVTILRKIVEKVCYPSKGELMPYVITLATPDTALMIMAGIYRNFEKVGYSLHDFLLASAEGNVNIEHLLSKYKVALVGELRDIGSIRQCLLKYPWFIDEFHLYGTYEAFGLLPVLKVYREYAGWEEPFILSSATPTGTLYEAIAGRYSLAKVEEAGRERGDYDTLVRGETEVEVVPVRVEGRGISKWFQTGYAVADVVSERLSEIKGVVGGRGRVFIVVDRVNQVPGIVDVLTSSGIRPECSVSIKPLKCSEKEELVLVGSESISQGIDRSNVRYGVITAHSWASLLQRFGRIGRKTDSKVVIVVPLMRGGTPLGSLNGAEVPYRTFAETVVRDFPDIDLKRMYEVERYRKLMRRRSALLEYASTIAFAQVSKPGRVLETLAGEARDSASTLLKTFYGPPEIITGLLTFRSAGFPVLVRKPDGGVDEADIATVLRNYGVEGAAVASVEKNGLRRSMVELRISFEPKRLKLVLRRDPTRQKYVRQDVAEHLTGRITTVGELINLGYRLVIRAWDGSGFEVGVPVTSDVRAQAIALLNLPEELVSAYSYSVRGIEVEVGERSIICLLM